MDDLDEIRKLIRDIEELLEDMRRANRMESYRLLREILKRLCVVLRKLKSELQGIQVELLEKLNLDPANRSRLTFAEYLACEDSNEQLRFFADEEVFGNMILVMVAVYENMNGRERGSLSDYAKSMVNYYDEIRRSRVGIERFEDTFTFLVDKICDKKLKRPRQANWNLIGLLSTLFGLLSEASSVWPEPMVVDHVDEEPQGAEPQMLALMLILVVLTDELDNPTPDPENTSDVVVSGGEAEAVPEKEADENEEEAWALAEGA